MESLQEELQNVFDDYGKITKLVKDVNPNILARLTIQCKDTTFAPLDYIVAEIPHRKIITMRCPNINTSIEYIAEYEIDIRQKDDSIAIDIKDDMTKLEFTADPIIEASSLNLKLAKSYMNKLGLDEFANQDDFDKNLVEFISNFYKSRIPTLIENNLYELNNYIDDNFKEITNIMQR